jgi:hypothetical protein
LNRVVDNGVLVDLFLGLSLSQIRHTVVRLPEVDLGETAIEQDFGGEELEVEAQLFIVTATVISNAISHPAAQTWHSHSLIASKV